MQTDHGGTIVRPFETRPAWRRVVLSMSVLVALIASAAPGRGVDFIRGDADSDGLRNITDAIFTLNCLFVAGDCATCTDAADANDDGRADISDAVFTLNWLFLGGTAPPAPGETCGPDPSDDLIDCRSFAPCAAPPDPDAIPTAAGDLVAVPIEHASLVLRWNGLLIHADPVGSEAQFAGLVPADLVVLTHTHGDHTDATTLRRVIGPNTVLVLPQSVATALAASGILDEVDARVLANGASTEISEDLTAHAIAMYNLTPDRERFHARGTGNGYVLDLAGTRVYVSGDTEDIPEMRALEAIDLAFLCMNLPFTMTPEQAASATLEFLPRVVYPYHYRGQDPEVFRELVEGGTTEVEVRLRNWYP